MSLFLLQALVQTSSFVCHELWLHYSRRRLEHYCVKWPLSRYRRVLQAFHGSGAVVTRVPRRLNPGYYRSASSSRTTS